MKRTVAATIALLAVTLSAQPQPAYVVASIKPNTSGSSNSSSRGSQGQVVFTNQSLKRLIERAYNVKPFQVTGPEWMENARFDIVAKYPPDTKDDDRSLMLRALLEDRFKLAVHRESKEMPGYALVVAKRGPKLKRAQPRDGSDTNTTGSRLRTLTAKNTSMAALADLISRNLSEIVVDRTGLEGAYDFELRWTNDDQNSSSADADAAPSLFTALQEALGLRLQPQKVPTEIIVVDHVERVPTEN
jgi:uncharacterized protein (TIGR03435 family)